MSSKPVVNGRMDCDYGPIRVHVGRFGKVTLTKPDGEKVLVRHGGTFTLHFPIYLRGDVDE